MQIIKFYEKGFDSNRLVVQWNLGNICNYSCEYCPSILHNGSRPWVELPLIEDTLLKIKNYFPSKKIRVEFLGGEITLYRDFINLMKFCKTESINNMIFTNASRTFRHWNETIDYLDEILLTFHPQTTCKDHFENVVKLFKNNNVKFYIHIAMVKELFWETVDYAEHLKKTYSDIHSSMVLMMDKEHKKNFRGYFYDYSQEEINVVKQYDSGSERYVAEYEDGKTKVFNLTEIKDYNINQFKGFACGVDQSILNIDFNGNASTSLCRQKSKINIYSDSIDKLFYKHICKLDKCENPGDIRIYKEWT